MPPENMASIAGTGAFTPSTTKTYPVPEESRAALVPLATVANEYEIRAHCAMTRKMNAIHRDGDAEKAIIEDRTYQDCAAACEESKAKVSEAVRQAVPEIPAGGNLRLEVPQWIVFHDAAQA